MPSSELSHQDAESASCSAAEGRGPLRLKGVNNA
jgi:hypothetical protein